MKKLLSLMLCIVFVCLALVSCGEDVIGEYLENYNTDTVTDDQIETLNFYIITGDSTTAEASGTVEKNINNYLKEKYAIELNIEYCTEAEYAEKLSAGMAETTEAARPDIILINSYDLYNANKDELVSLNNYYTSRDYRTLNTIVDASLLAVSAETDDNGEPVYYTVPNNHVIGEYKYIVIDKTMARDILHFSDAALAAMTTEESIGPLQDAIREYYAGASESEISAHIEQCVKIVSGSYADKQLLEYGVEKAEDITENALTKNFVNINAYPVTTKEEAHLSAFAIVKHLNDEGNNTEEQQAVFDKHYNKCMKIIYALNTDAQFKNMLQYGFVGVNYKFVKNEKNENTDYIKLSYGNAVTYEMNNIYTGNINISYFCEENGWNEQILSDIKKQNGDATK